MNVWILQVLAETGIYLSKAVSQAGAAEEGGDALTLVQIQPGYITLGIIPEQKQASGRN